MQELHNQDGFVENLFLYLWMQDPVINQIPNIKIPDTVLFRNSQIFQWYFFSGKQIKKKSKNKLNKEYLLDNFLRKIPKCGIVAQWIQKKSSIDKNQQETLTYQYFNKAQLIVFIQNQKPNDIVEGVLQKFVQPKGNQNSVVQVQWSNNLCFFEKIQNPLNINDQSLDIYQRALTYEINNSHAEIKQLKGTYLITSLETIANNIKQHIVNLSFERFKITRMNLIFKIVEDNQIILIGCQKIRLEDRKLKDQPNKQERVAKSLVQIPQNIDTSKLGLYKTCNIKQETQCKSCLKLINDFATYNIKIKFVIQSWEFDHDGKKQLIVDQEKEQFRNLQINQQQENMKNVQAFKAQLNFYQQIQSNQMFQDIDRAYNIPKVIRNIMPKIKQKKYLQLKENPGFNDTEVEVCEQCYLDIMSNCNIYESIEKLTKQVGRLDQFHGIGKLKPEQLNLRYNITRKNIQIQEILDEVDLNQLRKQKELIHDYANKNYNHSRHFSTSMISPYGSQFNQTTNSKQFETQEKLRQQQILDKVGIKSQTRSDFFMTTLQQQKSLPSLNQYRNLNRNQQNDNLNQQDQSKNIKITEENSSNNEQYQLKPQLQQKSQKKLNLDKLNKLQLTNEYSDIDQTQLINQNLNTTNNNNNNNQLSSNRNMNNLSTNQTTLMNYQWDQNAVQDPQTLVHLEKQNPRKKENKICQSNDKTIDEYQFAPTEDNTFLEKNSVQSDMKLPKIQQFNQQQKYQHKQPSSTKNNNINNNNNKNLNKHFTSLNNINQNSNHLDSTQEVDSLLSSNCKNKKNGRNLIGNLKNQNQNQSLDVQQFMKENNMEDKKVYELHNLLQNDLLTYKNKAKQRKKNNKLIQN